MNRQTSFVMTQGKTWILTAISVALFVLLCWLFADGLLGPPLWNAEDWTASPLITYLLILLALRELGAEDLRRVKRIIGKKG